MGVICRVGLSQAGLPGAVAAWLAFTTPSAIALILFGYGVTEFGDAVGSGAMRRLKVVAVAVVAQAVWTMARTLCPDAKRATLAVLATIGVLAVPSPFAQVGAIVIGALVGWIILRADSVTDHVDLGVRVTRSVGIAALAVFFTLLIGLPVLAAAYPSQSMALVDSFYRSGSLVFGGGHVVLPLLQAEVVPPGWVSKDAFLAGYGAAQAVPGPLFTFAAYLGTVMSGAPSGNRWRSDLSAGDICVVVSTRDRCDAVLGCPTSHRRGSQRLAWGQRGGGWLAARGPLRPGLDERHCVDGRFWSGPRGVRAPGVVEDPALAGGDPDRAWRVGALCI